ncbi:MAG: hypothetical protein LBJ72_02650 [Dysgonamonadaceae bacterium]|nr:hypothetical protein [Dysgonamonadaceae bacterium]
MKNLYIVCVIFFLSDGLSLSSAETVHERVFVYTDKECYVAGEDIRMKFCVMTPDLKPSTLSKVGYIEISDTQKPHLQLKLALKNGSGSGKVKIASHIPSGIYELSGYTGYMRNEDAGVVFKRKIAILNPGQKPEPGRAVLLEGSLPVKIPSQTQGNIKIKTDKNTYREREQVVLSLENLSQGLSEIVVSVKRNDPFASIESVDNDKWLRQVKTASGTLSGKWLPEYEGHIVTGAFTDNAERGISTGLSVVGNKRGFVAGQTDFEKGISSFYTTEIYGPQEIVTSVTNLATKELPNQLTVVSPFANYLPESLPELQVQVDTNLLSGRYLAAQLTPDSIDLSSQAVPESNYYTPTYHYDLNQYTRFPTLSETILEFVYTVKITKVNNERKFRVYSGEVDGFTSTNTLVLLDGIPVFEQENMVNYNPFLLRKLEIFDGRYVYGDRVYDCILSFTTHNQDLSSYQLGQGSLLFKYDFPFLPVPFTTPDYSDENLRNSRKPDFRHTLYWNPEVKIETGKPLDLSFYTSDLKGNFEVSVEGITSEGKMVSEKSCFEVR